MALSKRNWIILSNGICRSFCCKSDSIRKCRALYGPLDLTLLLKYVSKSFPGFCNKPRATIPCNSWNQSYAFRDTSVFLGVEMDRGESTCISAASLVALFVSSGWFYRYCLNTFVCLHFLADYALQRFSLLFLPEKQQVVVFVVICSIVICAMDSRIHHIGSEQNVFVCFHFREIATTLKILVTAFLHCFGFCYNTNLMMLGCNQGGPKKIDIEQVFKRNKITPILWRGDSCPGRKSFQDVQSSSIVIGFKFWKDDGSIFYLCRKWNE